jgi:hypothetical protein
MRRAALLLGCLATLLILSVAPAQAGQKIRGTYTGTIRLKSHGASWRVTLKVGTLHRTGTPNPPPSGRIRYRRRGRSCSGSIYYKESLGSGYWFGRDLHGDATGPCRPESGRRIRFLVSRRVLGIVGPQLGHGGIYYLQNVPGARSWNGKLRRAT